MKIVHSVGFDSIPSDLGTFLLHEHAGPLGPTTLAVDRAQGRPQRRHAGLDEGPGRRGHGRQGARAGSSSTPTRSAATARPSATCARSRATSSSAGSARS